MDDDTLIERAAADVVAAHAELDVAGFEALVCWPYEEQLEAMAHGVPKLREPYGLDPDEMPEVEYLEASGDAAARLLARIEDGEWRLSEAYFLALGRELHRRLGIPVLMTNLDTTEAEQLARQAGAAPADPLAGLDVVVSQRIDEFTVAAVWRGEWGLEGAASVARGDSALGIGYCSVLGFDPHVVAGRLPPGAVSVAVRGRGDWHEPAIHDGAWLCVLPERAGQKEPKVIFRDGDGTEFAVVVDPGAAVPSPFHGASVPALWPVQADGRPHLSSWGGPSGTVDQLAFRAGDWEVSILSGSPWERAAELVPGAPVRSLPGRILGQPHAFEIAAGDETWAAVADCGTFSIMVQGRGAPPARLDLDAVD